MTWFDIVALSVCALTVTLLILALCNRWLGVWACRVFGWHRPPLVQHFNGLNCTGHCPRCGEYVLQDSNGDWFDSSYPEMPCPKQKTK